MQNLQNGEVFIVYLKLILANFSIQANAHALARYSALVQECSSGSIVEPEVLMDGTHSAKDCYQKTSEVIKKCFEELILHKVDLRGIILKPNMILPGSNANNKFQMRKSQN